MPDPQAPAAAGNTTNITPGFAQPDLKIYARLAWRWLWLVAACALLGGAAACLVSLNLAPIYQAESKVLINEARTAATTNYNDILASERLARTYADLMQRRSVLDAALVRLGLDPMRSGAQVTGVTASPVRDTQLVALTIEGTDPELAAAVANTVPAVFVDELRKIQASRFAESKASLAQQLDALGRQVETARLQLATLEQPRTAQEELDYTERRSALAQHQAAYANLLQSYANLRLAEAQAGDRIVLIEAAAVPPAPVRPRVLFNTLLAAVVGALAALGVVCLVEYLDDRVQTPEDLQRIADVPVLGAIGLAPAAVPGKDSGARRIKQAGARHGSSAAPRSLAAPGGEQAAGEDLPRLISVTDPRHPVVEAYRRLRTNLQYYNLDTGIHGLMVTSAEAGEGKSMTAANLAVVMAQAGATVLLVDSDLRKPQQHRIFRLPRQPGLAEALRDGGLAPCLLQEVAGAPNLRVLTSGESVPNPAEVLGSQRMQQFVAQLRQEADILIFDTPPLLAVTDAQVVGRLAGGALLVIDSRKTAAAAVHRGLQALAQVNVPVMGAVLNRLTVSGRAYYYYCCYAHGYYAAPRS